jgi:hypothetical protein
MSQIEEACKPPPPPPRAILTTFERQLGKNEAGTGAEIEETPQGLSAQ